MSYNNIIIVSEDISMGESSQDTLYMCNNLWKNIFCHAYIGSIKNILYIYSNVSYIHSRKLVIFFIDSERNDECIGFT